MTPIEKLKLATSFCSEFSELEMLAVIGIKKATGNGECFLLINNDPIASWEISKEEIEEVQKTAHCQEIPKPNLNINSNFSNN